MKIVAMALSLAVTSGASVLFAPAAFSGPDCTCRYQGGEIREGETACIKSPKGMTMARCESVLNNTSWKMLDQPCPAASLGTVIDLTNTASVLAAGQASESAISRQ